MDRHLIFFTIKNSHLYFILQVVNLIGFSPFKTAADALANINSISEGIVHDDLKLFLDTNMPKVSSTFPLHHRSSDHDDVSDVILMF